MPYDKLGLHGHVVIKDKKTSRTLVDKDNMIVQEGREALLQMFLSGMDESLISDTTGLIFNNRDSLTNKQHKWIFKTAVLSESPSNEVEYRDTLTKITGLRKIEGSESHEYQHQLIDLVNTIMSLNVTDDSGHYYIKISTSIKLSDIASTAFFVSSLYLILEDENSPEKEQKMFSRIRFDQFPLTADTEYSLDYYIYF